MAFGICDFSSGWERLDFLWGGGGFGFLLGILGLAPCAVTSPWDSDPPSLSLFFTAMASMIPFSNLLEGFGRTLDFGVEVPMPESLTSIWWPPRIEMSFGGSSGLEATSDTVPFREISVSTLTPGLGNRLLFLGGGGGGIFLGLTSGPLLLSICPSFLRLRLGILELVAFSPSRLAIGVDVLIFRMILDDSTVSVDFTADEILGMLVGLDRVAMETQLFPVDDEAVELVVTN